MVVTEKSSFRVQHGPRAVQRDDAAATPRTGLHRSVRSVRRGSVDEAAPCAFNTSNAAPTGKSLSGRGFGVPGKW